MFKLTLDGCTCRGRIRALAKGAFHNFHDCMGPIIGLTRPTSDSRIALRVHRDGLQLRQVALVFGVLAETGGKGDGRRLMVDA